MMLSETAKDTSSANKPSMTLGVAVTEKSRPKIWGEVQVMSGSCQTRVKAIKSAMTQPTRLMR